MIEQFMLRIHLTLNNNFFQHAKGDEATIKAIDIVIGNIAQNIKE